MVEKVMEEIFINTKNCQFQIFSQTSSVVEKLYYDDFRGHFLGTAVELHLREVIYTKKEIDATENCAMKV